MDKTITGLLGAASALALSGAADASTPPPDPASMKPAQSYADLLDPIPNAAETLRALGEARPAAHEDDVRVAQVVVPVPVPMPGYGYRHHHHHHHYQQAHQGWYRWRYHHHHHHHHHHYWGY